MKICMPFLAILFAIFSAGCAKKFDISAPKNNAQTEFGVRADDLDARLVVLSKDGAYEFVMFDALGAPIAHKRLENGKFQSLKFLPPKGDLDGLFAGVTQILDAGANGGLVRVNSKKYEVWRVAE